MATIGREGGGGKLPTVLVIGGGGAGRVGVGAEK